jgi:hypothetical protein
MGLLSASKFRFRSAQDLPIMSARASESSIPLAWKSKKFGRGQEAHMSEPTGLIEHLKTRQPATWAMLELAALDGLVVIDEETDAVTATNRLLLTYPGLHDILATLTNAWAERACDPSAHVARLLRVEPTEENRDGAP